MSRKATLAVGAAIALVLVLATTAASVSAAVRGRGASAASIGLQLTSVENHLVVVRAIPPFSQYGFLPGDQIVAVNGRRVSTEAAFMARLTAKAGAQSAITVNRNGATLTANVTVQANATAVASGGVASGGYGGFGIMDPRLMVRTSQGIMHRDAAARLGLEGTPIDGAPDHPNPAPLP